MELGHLAVVMPAYNEAQSLPEFLAEIDDALIGRATRLTFVVVNDRSSDATAEVLDRLVLPSGSSLIAVNSPVNRGHGPTALNAYREGLASGAEVIVHVDGDGQFLGPDFVRLLDALAGADLAHGVRRGRTDPWFRRVITFVVFLVVSAWTRARVPDVNTPLRAYRREALERLLPRVPADALVPHVHFSVLERRLGLTVHHVRVDSIPRRGDSAVGTMWGGGARPPLLPPRKLLRFLARAAGEIWRYRIRHARVPAAGHGAAPA